MMDRRLVIKRDPVTGQYLKCPTNPQQSLEILCRVMKFPSPQYKTVLQKPDQRSFIVECTVGGVCRVGFGDCKVLAYRYSAAKVLLEIIDWKFPYTHVGAIRKYNLNAIRSMVACHEENKETKVCEILRLMGAQFDFMFNGPDPVAKYMWIRFHCGCVHEFSGQIMDIWSGILTICEVTFFSNKRRIGV